MKPRLRYDLSPASDGAVYVLDSARRLGCGMREAATRARRKTGGTCTTTTRDLHFELVLRFREKHSRRPVTGATRLFRGIPGVYANKNTELK